MTRPDGPARRPALFDSHLHLTAARFSSDRDEVVARARTRGVGGMVTVASDPEDAREAAALAVGTPEMWATAGLHPHAADRTSGALMDEIERIAAAPEVVAIGETGLDFHYGNADRAAQRANFDAHLGLAARLGLPVVVHSRSAEDDTAARVRAYGDGVAGVLHCFAGGDALLAAALEADWYVSVLRPRHFRARVGRARARRARRPAGHRDGRALPGPGAAPRAAERTRVSRPHLRARGRTAGDLVRGGGRRHDGQRAPSLRAGRGGVSAARRSGGRRIEILPDHVANQIAAGEVVERPASVVKELVENAIDAGARRVEVALRNGGKTEIQVSDDGSGMSEADAVLALERHATSKIRGAEDLRTVRSFGFRGEALPSIAAVSRFELHTAPRTGEGARVRVDFGRIRGVDAVARRRGTTVSVRSLFHDLPARAKFLKTAAAETRAAGEAMVLLALANPGVGFHMTSNRRVSLDVGPAADALGRVGQLWADLAETLIPAAGSEGEITVRGFVQRPDAAGARGGRRYAFVNGRPFRDPGLLRLVDEAFRTTVVEGLRPSFFLWVKVPPERVDVNVHPAKAEVRFRDREQVETAVRDAVRRALARLDSTKPMGRPGMSPRTPDRGRRAAASAEMPQFALFVQGRGDASRRDVGRAGAGGDAAGREVAESAPGVVPGTALGGDAGTAFTGPELWRLHDRYILAPTREGLLIVDQHAAHERVLFEEAMARFETGGGASQALLFPATMQFSPPEAAALEDLSGFLRRLGFELEPFGERTWLLRAAPAPHARFDPERCLREMVRELAEGSPLVDAARNQHERIAMSMACKAAIKAGEHISPEEARELFDRLFATKLPGHDVHGRPTIVRLSVEELDRRFGRT